MMEANAIQVRIGELCHQFRLPTMGAQSVSRFTAAGHGDALNQYHGGMCISGVLKTTERTPLDLVSPWGLKWTATDIEV